MARYDIPPRPAQNRQWREEEKPKTWIPFAVLAVVIVGAGLLLKAR